MKNIQLPDRRLGLFYGSQILATYCLHVISLGVRLMSGGNGVNPAEPAVKIDRGAALRTKRAVGESRGFAADRTGPGWRFVWFFSKTAFRSCGWHGLACA
jgi:hypothetical protein